MITKTIAVDFDLTICDSKFPECGPPIQGVKEALHRFKELGYYIIISSCRTCHWRYDLFPGTSTNVKERPATINMEKFLIEHELPFDEIDYGDRGKVIADFTICDKAI